MQEELRRISIMIDSLLTKDEFPSAVEPDYLRDAVRDYPLNGGKRLRPALMLWSCELWGGDPEHALYPAAAAEIFHNWTLVHDDIIDDDATRRNRPTCHVRLATACGQRFALTAEKAVRTGRNFAILAGDLQQGWANDMLMRSVEHGVAASVAVALSRRMQQLANNALITGEALDVELSLRNLESVSPDEVRRMFVLKTGALLRFCMESGTLIALNSDDTGRPEVIAMGKLADLIGTIFQLRDDYLGIFGKFNAFGKTIGADLRENKATVLLLYALKHGSTAERAKLKSLLGREKYSAADIAEARKLMISSGASDALLNECAGLAGQARDILAAMPQNRACGYLNELVEYLLTREK